ncbi:unnamed protein product, partial [Meganyctiphanes norvegica]
ERLHEQDAVIKKITTALDKSQTELEKERAEGAEVVRLVEAATEAEIGQVRSNLHAQLAEEKQNVIKLRSERAALRKNFLTAQRECEGQTTELRDVTEERSKLQGTIRGLERELAALRKEVDHRDDIIHDREGKISGTRDRVGDLEKQKFLLEHQLSELKDQMMPLQTALEQRAHQIKQLEEEAGETRLTVAAKERQVREVSSRLSTAVTQLKDLQNKHHCLATALGRVLADLSTMTQHFHHPKKLKEAVKNLNDKYISSGRLKEFWTREDLDKTATATSPDQSPEGTNEGAVPELLRQREMLERSVATLRAQSAKQARAHKDKTATLVKENSLLLGQVNQMESRVWQVEGQLRQMESINGFTNPRTGRRRADRETLVDTVKKQATTIIIMQDKLRGVNQDGEPNPKIELNFGSSNQKDLKVHLPPQTSSRTGSPKSSSIKSPSPHPSSPKAPSSSFNSPKLPHL